MYVSPSSTKDNKIWPSGVERLGWDLTDAIAKRTGDNEFYLLGYNAVYSVERRPTCRRNMSPPYSGPKKSAEQENSVKGGGKFATLKMKAICPLKRRLTLNGLHGANPRRWYSSN
jgi:hypothetical protein